MTALNTIRCSLLHQGVPEEYFALQKYVYVQQSGSIHSSRTFTMQPGVKQGDILSPLLFNAGSEEDVAAWKRRMREGLGSGAAERLIRFADDLIYAKILLERHVMLCFFVFCFSSALIVPCSEGETTPCEGVRSVPGRPAPSLC